MTYDWIHQKFFDKFLHIQNNLEHSQGKDITDDRKSSTDIPEVKGHRYRYFIPQVNTKINAIYSCSFSENPLKNKESSFLKEDEKLENKIDIKNEVQNVISPQLFSKIKKIYIISNNNKTDFLRNCTYFMKQAHPTIHNFLVIPLPDEDLMKNQLSKHILTSTKAMVEDTQENLTKFGFIIDEAPKHELLDVKPEDKIDYVEDAIDYIEDIFDNEDLSEKSKNKREQLNTSYRTKKSVLRPSEDKEDPIKIPSINLLECENLDENQNFQRANEKEFDSFNLSDDWWWDNMVEPEMYDRHKKFQMKSKETLETKQIISFSSFLKNILFKINVKKSYDDWENSIDD